ncbi:MAG: bifunctional adenosylcobinamide kinase/adenosylcobinamide-phosphate guanylyltransferase [Pseudomonadota bacterium]
MSDSHRLILGGARSGKSRAAEKTALDLTPNPLYVATAEALDEEMQQRICIHQSRRDSNWSLIEEPIHLGDILVENSNSEVVLVDCLTLWLSNCLHHGCWPEQRKSLINALEQTDSTVIMVSNEVGNGIVPMGELSRTYVDESGWLHQDLAKVCSHVTLIMAGLEQTLKSPLK